MVQWEDLSWLQKAAFWTVIGLVGWFAPEIALLFHFGGIEVVFAVLAMYMMPIIRQVQGYIAKLNNAVNHAYLVFFNSASVKPKVFLVQASFCVCAFMLTGSLALSASFFMPGMLFNSALV